MAVFQKKNGFLFAYLLPAILLCILLIMLIALSILPGYQAVFSSSGFLLMLQLLLAVLVGLLLFYMGRHLIKDEKLRRAALSELNESREQYRALVETSADGTLLVMGEELVFANFVFLAMSGYTLKEVLEKKVSELLIKDEEPEFGLDKIYEMAGDVGRTSSMEAKIICKRGELRDVVLNLSHISLMGQDGIILIFKDITRKERVEKETSQLMMELQSSILLMNLPVSGFVREHIKCGMNETIREAAAKMQRKKQDSILISADEGMIVGIVTDKDLRNRVVAGNKDLDAKVVEIMSSPLIKVSDESLLYETILLIKEKGISHLAVENRNGEIIGIFSNEDLLEVQRNSISYLIKEISKAESLEGLKAIHNKVPGLIETLLNSGAKIQNVTHMISSITDAITHRLIEFAIDELGEPPAAFAFLALGSEGRREQTLVTDQDNAIVFEDVNNERLGEVSKYFLYFGKKINLWLDRIGYQYCKGEIMAGNPQWCQPMGNWKKYFTDWIAQKNDTGSLGMSVFFDFRTVYGDKEFSAGLGKHIWEQLSERPDFLKILAKEVCDYEIPLDVFKLSDSIDTKVAISPLVDFSRVYSMQYRITETNTLQRLDMLLRLGAIPEQDYHETENLYSRIMEIRFRSQVKAFHENRVPENLVNREELTQIEQAIIIRAFSELSSYQEKIFEDFKNQ